MSPEPPGDWIVYIIETHSGKLYTGITTDLERRFREHAEGRKGARFFRGSPPARILYREKQPDRSQATIRERAIKSLSRKAKLALIDTGAADEADVTSS